MKRDVAIDALLDLNGSILGQGNGYWIKLEAWRVLISNDPQPCNFMIRFDPLLWPGPRVSTYELRVARP